MATRARQRHTPVFTASSEGTREAREPVIYVRVSTYAQRQKGFSLQHQFELCKEAAAAAHTPVLASNVLHDVDSGRNFQRTSLQALLERVRAGQVGVVYCPKVDRLGRSARDCLETLDTLHAHGTDLVLVQNHIDTREPLGRLFFTLLAAFAEWEADMIKERTWAGKYEQLSQFEEAGRAPGAGARSIPYGLLYRDGTWQRHPDQARWVLFIFERVARGKGGKIVARMLNERGVPPPRGTQWSPETVRRIVHSRTYIGTLERRMQGQVFVFAVPPIVPEDLWHLANEAVRYNRATSPRNSKHEYLLSSSREDPLLCCLVCRESVGKDSMMGGRSNGNKSKREWLFYECNARAARDGDHTVPATRLETAVWNALVGMLTDPSLVLENISKLADAASQEHQDLQRKLAGLEERAAEVRAAQARLAELAAWGRLPRDIIETQAEALESEAQEVAGQISLARVQLEQARAETIPIGDIETACAVLAEGAAGATFEEKRWIVRTLVHRIYADKKTWTLEGRLPHLRASGPLHSSSRSDTIEVPIGPQRC